VPTAAPAAACQLWHGAGLLCLFSRFTCRPPPRRLSLMPSPQTVIITGAIQPAASVTHSGWIIQSAR